MSAFLNFYATSLKKNPKTTNAIMTGSLFGLGDAIAQVSFPTQKADPTKPNGKSDSRGYDIARTVRAITYGSLIFSFIGDKWFKTLNGKVKFANKPANHWSNLLLRVGTDQLLFAPACIPFYFGVLTLMEGESLQKADQKIRAVWWDILKTNWMVWPAFQLVNFSLVPLQHRLLAVNMLAIFWNTFLSFRNSEASNKDHQLPVEYPPVPE
ncbi:LANO_0G13828g1_1 [Lachancea nothofagi CBS 11611]|uniref:Protein SYM1 n=1 Tax=Lachancea nothofagi CBS 11611 TaxID=1266666 RepID=A0A1G4KK13_9SACH|nr:LANO_0G13828g1_1 [Lachancea nothofagi CBS 11611]